MTEEEDFGNGITYSICEINRFSRRDTLRELCSPEHTMVIVIEDSAQAGDGVEWMGAMISNLISRWKSGESCAWSEDLNGGLYIR